MNVIKLILRNLDGFRTRFILVFVAGIFGGVFSFCISLALTQFTKGGFDLEKFYILVPVMLGIYAGYLFFAWVLRKYGESLAAQFENHIRLKYFKRLETLPTEQIAKLHSGYILSLFNQIGTSLYWVIFHFCF
jgi:ABC-type multidrug transport system fused ATPase/permease subunit